MTIYTAAERAQYQPPPCPSCNRPVQQHWADVTSRFDPEPLWIPGRWSCTTPGCQYGPPEGETHV